MGGGARRAGSAFGEIGPNSIPGSSISPKLRAPVLLLPEAPPATAGKLGWTTGSDGACTGSDGACTGSDGA